MKKYGLYIGLFVFIISSLTPTISFAWDSVGYETHERIAYDAVHVLSSEEYPDLYIFEIYLRHGSESEAPHPDDRYNGGNAFNWWDRKAKLSYNAFNFYRAYFQIGEVAHLTQDQAVPAHAANIKHGPYNYHLDDLELYADWYYISSPSNGYITNSSPDEYYQPLQDATRSSLTS